MQINHQSATKEQNTFCKLEKSTLEKESFDILSTYEQSISMYMSPKLIFQVFPIIIKVQHN